MASALLGSATSTLPTELTLLVLDHLEGNNQALCSLARTCRSMQRLAEERVYKTIELTSVVDLRDVSAAFLSRYQRLQAVQTLKLLYQYEETTLKNSDRARAEFNKNVPHMINLREWHIESPWDNFHWSESGGDDWVGTDMEQFRAALDLACENGLKETEVIAAERQLGKHMERKTGLALLETLTIHSHGRDTDFWDLDGYHCLFRHPSLRHLHVSCIAFPGTEIPELASYVNKTPLTSLVFDECVLDPQSLLSILQTPAQLKSLTLGENVYNTNRSKDNPMLSKYPVESLRALSAVAHSLETLVHLDPGSRIDSSSHVMSSIRTPGDGMRDFHSLKYMECDTQSFLHKAIIMNRDLAPPKLETLRVRRHWDSPANLWDEPPNLDHYAALPSISTLELMQSSFILLRLSTEDYICEAERLRNRHAKAYKLSKAGINLKMLIELHKTRSLIPPYLHNEQVPLVQCLYNASAVGFHRHIEDLKVHEAKLEAPETDQLSDADVIRIRESTRKTLFGLKQKLLRQNRPLAFQTALFDDADGSEPFTDEEGFLINDIDEDDDMDLDDLDDDSDFLDDDDFFDGGDGGMHMFMSSNGNIYVGVHADGSEDESMGSEEENDDMVDALEHQQPPNDEVD
ncbi:hypothetical protein Ptr902_11989 [Pyrenophora tritici-repentis]|nr:hypothetical protein Ptr902_11989 [Pyrenophora tritici-repentis]